jgi:hypothetical protein
MKSLNKRKFPKLSKVLSYIDKAVPKEMCDCGATSTGSNMHSTWCKGVKPAEASSQEIEKLAKKFSELLRSDHTAEEMEEVIEKNREHKANGDNGICATHDICDANMVMLDAFKSVTGREPSFLTDSENEADMPLWNKAWELAKANEFWV